MRTVALILVALLPLAAQAQSSMDGTYAEDCTIEANDGRLTIAGSTAQFHESSCTLTNPVAVRGMTGAVLYDMVCSGEGESWTHRTLLMPGYDGGLVRVEEGFAVTYPRCP